MRRQLARGGETARHGPACARGDVGMCTCET
jgi:hypothetical protein